MKDGGDFAGHYPCIGSECSDKHDCHSSDGLAIYQNTNEDGSIFYDGFCWSCNQYFSPEHISKSSVASDLGIENGVVVDKTKVVAKPKKEPMTKEEVIQFIKDIGYAAKGIRGIKDEYNQFYGHLTKLDSSGNPVARFYPETEEGKVTGYKSRIFPKKFGMLNKGRTGIKSELSGQVKFKSGGKYLLICGGEEDKVAAFQMLRDSQKQRNQEGFEPIAVVSPTTGESSAVKQIAAQYDFCNSFDNIILGLDNDEAGILAMAEIAKVLPADKVKIATWTMKDPNKMLESGKQDQFVRDFYSAKQYLDDGIISSIDADDGLEEELSRPKIQLPDFMCDLQKAFSGGIPLGYWVNWIAGTGAGKCHGKDTPILMADGSIKMVQDVVENDMLMGAEGSARKVLSTVTGKETLYKVTQIKGESYVVNESHILSLRVSSTFIYKGFTYTKGDTLNISVTEYLGLPAKYKTLLKGYKADLKNLGAVDIHNDYLLGLWLADGETKGARITVYKEDLELLEYLDSGVHGYTVHNYSVDKDNCILVSLSDGFRSYLRELNMLGNKHIPKDLLLSSYTSRLNLLAGILDGDGYLTNNGYELICKDLRLASDVKFLAKSLGLAVNLSEKFSKCQNFEGAIYYRLSITGHTDKIPCKLTRKQAQPRRQIKDPLVTGITLECLGEGDYYGFQIDGDHLYCLGDFTVTHNTTTVNEAIRKWIYTSPYKVGIVSLELTAAQYMIAMLSREVGYKINLIEDPQKAIEFIKQPHVIEARNHLKMNEFGEERFALLDDREGTLDNVKKQIERLIKKHGCKLIVIDPLNDLFDASTWDEQTSFIKWMKNTMKYGITFSCVCHVRKGNVSTDKAGKRIERELTEDDVSGLSLVTKSAGANIFLNRSKYAEDEIVRNTTKVTLGKCRWTGVTGVVGNWYYDIQTHTMHNFNTFFSQPEPDFAERYEGVDLEDEIDVSTLF